MRLHRFIGEFDLSAKRIESRDAGLAHQLGNVFRLHAGDEVVLCDGSGRETKAAIEEIGKGKVIFLSSGDLAICPAPRRSVTLYAAILRRENFELIVQKAVECGVARVVPLVTKRTIKQAFRADRLQKIALEAAEQCGRGTVPEITEPQTLEKSLSERSPEERSFFCDFDGKSLLSGITAASPDRVGIFIGPEGGWDASEREQAIAAGCEVADLGKLTLRGETAAIVAVWIAVNA